MRLFGISPQMCSQTFFLDSINDIQNNSFAVPYGNSSKITMQ